MYHPALTVETEQSARLGTGKHTSSPASTMSQGISSCHYGVNLFPNAKLQLTICAPIFSTRRFPPMKVFLGKNLIFWRTPYIHRVQKLLSWTPSQLASRGHHTASTVFILAQLSNTSAASAFIPHLPRASEFQTHYHGIRKNFDSRDQARKKFFFVHLKISQRSSKIALFPTTLNFYNSPLT